MAKEQDWRGLFRAWQIAEKEVSQWRGREIMAPDAQAHVAIARAREAAEQRAAEAKARYRAAAWCVYMDRIDDPDDRTDPDNAKLVDLMAARLDGIVQEGARYGR